VVAVHEVSLFELAAPHLERLVEQTGETANLAVKDDDSSALYLNSIVSPRTIRHASWLGRTVPLAVRRSGRRFSAAPDRVDTSQSVEPPSGMSALSLRPSAGRWTRSSER
jgi:DNA-binding IclR family transcriptional regulator